MGPPSGWFNLSAGVPTFGLLSLESVYLILGKSVLDSLEETERWEGLRSYRSESFP